MKRWLAGADGCKGGWVVVLREVGSGSVLVRKVGSIEDVFRWKPSPEVLGVDIPMGLLDGAVPGGRECDRAARGLLKQPRSRSVFSPPARPALAATRYREALRLNRRTSEHRVGISRQCFGIFDKMLELDRFLTPSLQRRVVEVHPELSFWELNEGAPVVEPKKTPRGRKQRVRLLEKAWRGRLSEIVEANRSSTVSRDDVIDAMAVCWTAERVSRGKAIRLPAYPPEDSRGLRMEIVR